MMPKSRFEHGIINRASPPASNSSFQNLVRMGNRNRGRGDIEITPVSGNGKPDSENGEPSKAFVIFDNATRKSPKLRYPERPDQVSRVGDS